MTTLRSYLDPDQQTATGPTSFLTDRNEIEVRCGVCARAMYVDDETACNPNVSFIFACRCASLAKADPLAAEGPFIGHGHPPVLRMSSSIS